ncbi:hypothetical protein FB45DRAFT_869367 [Roridomyces roridus]|uniref:Uncharacterized protein n=1 Tax=Roridomyces roridus TaxID=1738132 RepID=A0AAD7BLN5_9AGAR|nr:hypothetical protein FB45DRAFT_869367 [Roridomyces roridus]
MSLSSRLWDHSGTHLCIECFDRRGNYLENPRWKSAVRTDTRAHGHIPGLHSVNYRNSGRLSTNERNKRRKTSVVGIALAPSADTTAVFKTVYGFGASLHTAFPFPGRRVELKQTHWHTEVNTNEGGALDQNPYTVLKTTVSAVAILRKQQRYRGEKWGVQIDSTSNPLRNSMVRRRVDGVYQASPLNLMFRWLQAEARGGGSEKPALMGDKMLQDGFVFEPIRPSKQGLVEPSNTFILDDHQFKISDGIVSKAELCLSNQQLDRRRVKYVKKPSWVTDHEHSNR